MLKYLFVSLTLVPWPIAFILSLNRLPPPRLITRFDYQARQEILGKTYLYPNVFLARLFQNKIQIPVSKFENNLTSIIDPNNYFFGFHPREIPGVDNPVKFPFTSLPIFFFALLNLGKLSRRRLLVGSFLILTVTLSLVENYYYYDFLLYFPFTFLFLWGLKNVPHQFSRLLNAYYFTSLPLISVEIIRQFLIYFPK